MDDETAETDSRSTHDAIPDVRNDDVRIYINGDFFPRDEAKIPVFDSGYLTGDGIWEGIRLHRGKFVFLEDHLDRLYQAASATAIGLPESRDFFVKALHETASINGMNSDGHCRLMVTRGNKKTPSQDPRLTINGPTIVIICEYKQADPETTNRGLRLFTSTVRRGTPDTLDPRLNCHSKLHEVIALNQAIAAGADEALMLDVHGFVATCNSTNFFMVKNGRVTTSTGQFCLNGITRGKVIETARLAGIEVLETDFSLTEVYDADEAFVTGTFGGLTPVIEVDGRPVGSGRQGEGTRQLRDLYYQCVEQYVAREK